MRGSYFDSDTWQKVGNEQLARSAQRRRIADYSAGTMENNVNDMLAREDGVSTVGGARYTMPARSTRRWGGF